MQKEYQKKGLDYKKSKIERNLLEKTAQEWYAAQTLADEGMIFNSRAKRQEIFDKNY